MEGLDAVTVGFNSTGADDSCEWFVSFTRTPGNVDEVPCNADEGFITSKEIAESEKLFCRASSSMLQSEPMRLVQGHVHTSHQINFLGSTFVWVHIEKGTRRA